MLVRYFRPHTNFFVLENMQITTFGKPVSRRSMKNFDLENFLSDLQKQRLYSYSDQFKYKCFQQL